MPNENTEALIDEIRAFLRAESATRKAWRHRAWIGRRIIFSTVEARLLHGAKGNLRNDDEGRHALVSALVDDLEAIGAVDFVAAGRWAQENLEDPTDATRPVEVWGPEGAPVSTTAYVERIRAALNRREGKR